VLLFILIYLFVIHFNKCLFSREFLGYPSIIFYDAPFSMKQKCHATHWIKLLVGNRETMPIVCQIMHHRILLNLKLILEYV